MNNHSKMFSNALVLALTLLSTAFSLLPAGAADSTPAGPDTTNGVPLSWIDPDTGHRVIRLTREPGSDSFYFNINCFTPDGTRMVYTTPDGISVLTLATLVDAGRRRAGARDHCWP